MKGYAQTVKNIVKHMIKNEFLNKDVLITAVEKLRHSDRHVFSDNEIEETMLQLLALKKKKARILGEDKFKWSDMFIKLEPKAITQLFKLWIRQISRDEGGYPKYGQMDVKTIVDNKVMGHVYGTAGRYNKAKILKETISIFPNGTDMQMTDMLQEITRYIIRSVYCTAHMATDIKTHIIMDQTIIDYIIMLVDELEERDRDGRRTENTKSMPVLKHRLKDYL